MAIGINCDFAARILSRFIQEELGKAGFQRGILGLSGGLDSAVCAALAARALGPKNVVGLLMPYGEGFGKDMEDARAVAARLKIRTKTIDIRPMIDAYFERYPAVSRLQKGNKMARERMSILYDHSVRESALILGTSNKTELLIGYGTVHGDLASAVNPLGDLYKTQIREMARFLDVPASLLSKAPSAGLWAGQTDEGEIGMTYARIDEILYHLVDGRESKAEVIARGIPKARVERVFKMIRASEFKRQMPPIAKISARTVGHDFLYPYDWDK
jgi:NAD+ synthase